MLLFERIARGLQLLHLVGGAVLVASATHQLIACRGYLSGKFNRARAERRYVAILAIAYSANFLVGAALYPTYKVRVRAEYFDAPAAIAKEVELRQGAALAPTGNTSAGDRTWVSRLFDVKEHWVALGGAASLLLWLLSRRAHPERDRRVLALYLGLSAFVCASSWLGAIVGAICASYRSLGAA